MIGFTKLLTGKATVAEALRSESCGSVPPHLLQFTSSQRPIVVWNMTRLCNLHCRHCYMDAGGEQEKGELSTSQGMRLIDELGDLKVPVLLFSGGEPLLRSDIWVLGEHAGKRGLRPVLSSNGTLITRDSAQRLADSGFAYVGVSIDGSQQTHDRFRNLEGAFAMAMRGIYNAQRAGLKTGVRFTVNKYNFQDLPYIFDLLREEGVPRFCLYHLVYAGRGRELAGEDLDPGQKRELVELLLERVEEFRNQGVSVEILTTDNHADGIYLYHWVRKHLPERAEEVKALLESHGGCSAGVKMANIDPGGNVYPCQFWRSSSLGRFPERSFQEIWYDDGNPLLKRLRHKQEHLQGRCGRCRYNTLCGGCRIRAEAVSGDIWAEDPACYLTEEEIGI